MTDYLTEQEQVDLLKNWIKQYTPVVLLSILIATLSLSGWNYWKEKQNIQLGTASTLYDEVLTLRAQNNSTMSAKTEELFKAYPKTIYGQMASLMLAKDAMAANQYSKARSYFEWIIERSSVKAFKDIARLRLARIFLVEKKFNDSLAILDKIEDQSFKSLASEIKGDVYVATNNTAMAIKMYDEALSALPEAEAMRPLLRMKKDNLTPLQTTSG